MTTGDIFWVNLANQGNRAQSGRRPCLRVSRRNRGPRFSDGAGRASHNVIECGVFWLDNFHRSFASEWLAHRFFRPDFSTARSASRSLRPAKTSRSRANCRSKTTRAI